MIRLVCSQEEKHSPIKSFDHNGNVLYIGSLSKVVASSLRVGCIIGPQSVINLLADARQQIDFGISIFPQLIANQFLQSPEYPKHLHFLRQKLYERRNEMISTLQKYLGEQ